MREVLEQAQKLGEAILASDIWKNMNELEQKATSDPEAVRAVSDYMEKRKAVEELLGGEVDPDALAKAGEAVENAEKAMNEVTVLKQLKESREAYNTMMDNVNKILTVIVTGKLGGESSGCTGSCATCGGCH